MTPPAALLEREVKDASLTETPRAERVIWRINSRLSEGLLGGGSRKIWTLERRLP